MKNSRTIVTAMVAVLLFVSATVSIAFSSEAEGTDSLTTYSEQLTSNQLLIYQSLEKLEASDDISTLSYKVEVKEYRLSVYVGSDEVKSYRDTYTDTSAGMTDEEIRLTIALDKVLETVYPDAIKAMQATKLDNAFAFWTWSADQMSFLLNGQGHFIRESDEKFEDQVKTQIVSISEGYYGLQGLEFNVYVNEAYASGDDCSMKSKVDKTHEALETVEIKGETAKDIVKNVNEYLTGTDFRYDDDYEDEEKANPYNGTVYGAFVHKDTDGKHAIVCMAYASAFQAICEKYSTPCKTVVGLAETKQNPGLHAWNYVIIEEKVYALDSTWNASTKNAYLAVGELTTYEGVTFAQSHQPFAAYASYYYNDYASVYTFVLAEDLEKKSYEWPQPEKTITDYLAEYGQWIVVAVICIALSYVIIDIARKESE